MGVADAGTAGAGTAGAGTGGGGACSAPITKSASSIFSQALVYTAASRIGLSSWEFWPYADERLRLFKKFKRTLARLIHDGGVVRVDWGLAALAT